ncbi:MAG: MFS transporter [Myxococcaceae bacterium]|nr:MFS transporter [Myxococcaceae bacterium]MCI0670112.1 MFS transporter [Myxococcaceae bacterium]
MLAASASASAAPPKGVLARLGMATPATRAWALYDWANSAFFTSIITAVFPIYFGAVAGKGLPPGEATVRFGLATTVSLAAVAVLSPVLGALADAAPLKKRLLALFVALGVISTAGLFFVKQGDWLLGAVLFGLANVGISGGMVFYDSLLPHLARSEEEMDRLSTAGYALGYLGGGLFLVLHLAMLQKPEWFGLPSGEGLSPDEATLPARLVFVSVAVWWALFSIPLFLRVKEPEVRAAPLPRAPGAATRQVFRELGRTVRQLRAFPSAVLLLVAFLIYNDGIGTIIRMATIYGTEIGIEQGALIGAVLLVQFVGVPFGFLFGTLAARFGAKRAILAGLVVYAGISILGYQMTSAAHFFALAALVGMVQGGTQALSRSLFASLIPRHKSGEFFGFFSVMEKAAGLLGPLTFSVSAALTGSSRNAILSVILFFVVGGWLLSRVRVEEGQEQARLATPPGV